jgi:hypothetical protein
MLHELNKGYNPKWWQQLMDYYQEFACLTDLGDKVMDGITWRIKYEYTMF